MPVLLRMRLAAARRAARPDRAAARHPARRDRADPAARLPLLPAGRRGLRAGLDRADLVRRGGAVRAGHPRRHLLEGRHARRRALRPGRRLRGLGLHPAAAVLRALGLAADRAARRRGRSASRCSSRSSSSACRASTRSPTRCSGACSRTSAPTSACRSASRQSAVEQRQATLFVDVFRGTRRGDGARFWRGTASVRDLHALLGALPRAGARPTRRSRDYARARGLDWPDERARGRRGAGPLRRDAAGGRDRRGLGARHGRLGRGGGDAGASTRCCDILDEASQVIAYSHQLEQKSRELEAATAELRAANERLQELDRLKDDFISTVTHELRTPLTSIRAFSEILHDNPDLEPAAAGRASSASSSRRASA